MTSQRVLSGVIIVSTMIRLGLAANLGAYANEAYYFMYARHLDWGFYDHPPMVGLVAALSLKLAGGLSPALGLRLGSIALFAGSTWLVARLTTRRFGPVAGVVAAILLNATVFHSLVAGMLAGPDGPLLFFWLLALDRLDVALDDPRRSSVWVTVGVA